MKMKERKRISIVPLNDFVFKGIKFIEEGKKLIKEEKTKAAEKHL